MYMARYNFAFAQPADPEKYGFSKEQFGTIISAASLIYGLSAIFNGPIADRLGGRRAMLIGATGALVFNFAFGLAAYLGFLGTGTLLLAYLATTWSLNKYFQSYSALALIKVNAAWFHVNERGVFSAIFGSMIQSGRFFVYLLMTIGARRRAALAVEVLPPVGRRSRSLLVADVLRRAEHAQGRGPRRFRPAGRDERRHRGDHVPLRRAEGVHEPDRDHDRRGRVLHGPRAQGVRGVVPALHAGGAAPPASTTRSSRRTRSRS